MFSCPGAHFCYYKHMQRILGLARRYESIGKFLLVGCSSLAVDYCLLLVLYRLIGAPLAVATTIAFLVGLAVNFCLNKYWTFGAPGGTGQTSRQAALYGLLVVVNLLFTSFFIVTSATMHVGPELSKPVATAVIMVVNYIVYRQIVFK